MDRIPTFFSWPYFPFEPSYHSVLRVFREKALRCLHALVIVSMLLPDLAGFVPHATRARKA